MFGKQSLGAIVIAGALLSATAAHAENEVRVRNGTFSTGDFEGWDTIVGEDADLQVYDPFGGDDIDPRAVFTGTGLSTITQTFETGYDQGYRLSFDLSASALHLYSLQPEPGAFVFRVSIDGAEIRFDGNDVLNWGTQTLDFRGSGYSTLSFEGAAADGMWQLDNIRIDTADVAGAVPEPASWAMMICGFGMVGGAVRRTRRTTLAFA